MAERQTLTLLRSDRRIVIKESGGSFLVAVDPAPEGPDMTATFPTYRAARGHAGGLRLINRWPIHDETCGGDGLSK